MSAMPNLSRYEIEELLDLNSFYELRKARVPVERDAIFPNLSVATLSSTTKTPPMTSQTRRTLFAKDLAVFDGLKLKAPRVIVYSGDSKIETKLEQIGQRGYAAGFEGLHNFIMDQLKDGEKIIGALRQNVYRFPSLTVRELLANTIVHQDFTVEGTQLHD